MWGCRPAKKVGVSCCVLPTPGKVSAALASKANDGMLAEELRP